MLLRQLREPKFKGKTESNYAKKVAAFENSVGSKFGENTDDITLIMGQLFYKKNKEISAKIAQDLINSYSKRLNVKNRGANISKKIIKGYRGGAWTKRRFLEPKMVG